MDHFLAPLELELCLQTSSTKYKEKNCFLSSVPPRLKTSCFLGNLMEGNVIKESLSTQNSNVLINTLTEK